MAARRRRAGALRYCHLDDWTCPTSLYLVEKGNRPNLWLIARPALIPSQEDEGTVDLLPELARWCRRSCREGGAAAAFVSQVMREVGTSHPRRVLLALGARAEGRGFLLGCAEEYEVALRAASTRLERARLLAALGSTRIGFA